MAANVKFFWNSNTSYNSASMSYVNTTPKTPALSNTISIQDIKAIFGKGNEPTSPGLELDNYQGLDWWSPDYPHSRGRFGSTGPISYSDLHYKHGEDPIAPGMFIDTHGSVSGADIKNFVVPPYREWIKFEIWGAGGSGGGSSYYGPYINGEPGSDSRVFGIIVGGGAGGTGGVRTGAQSGTGGNGGTITGTITTSPLSSYYASGARGGNGEAVSGRGNLGGDCGNTANIEIASGVFSSGIGGRRGGNGPDVNPAIGDITYRSDITGIKGGKDGLTPGGGGGSAGYSEFRSSSVSRAAGGAGGGGAYASFYFTRSQMAVGNTIPYTIGRGGVSNNVSHGTASSRGAWGANGAFRVTWV